MVVAHPQKNIKEFLVEILKSRIFTGPLLSTKLEKYLIPNKESERVNEPESLIKISFLVCHSDSENLLAKTN